MGIMRIFDFDTAVMRTPGTTVVHGLRAHDGPSPDYHGVIAEHAAYAAALGAAGVKVEMLPPLEAYPDAMFVEDPALVFTEGAILLRPGTATRVGEAETLRPALERLCGTVIDLAAGHVDGGDVLVTPDGVLIGLSTRTDETGEQALCAALDRFGHHGRIVRPPAGVLHLKTAATLIDEATILTTRACDEAGLFGRLRRIVVPAGEEAAANALRVNDHLFVGDRFARTNAMLDREGYRLVPLATRQIGLIDAGLTCLSLRWRSAVLRH